MTQTEQYYYKNIYSLYLRQKKNHGLQFWICCTNLESNLIVDLSWSPLLPISSEVPSLSPLFLVADERWASSDHFQNLWMQSPGERLYHSYWRKHLTTNMKADDHKFGEMLRDQTLKDDALTVIACMTTWGSWEYNLLTMERKQSLAFWGEVPTLSQMSIIFAQSSDTFFSLVAFSAQLNVTAS